MALITSRTFRGKCPVCGAVNCACPGTSGGTGGSGVLIRPPQKVGQPLVSVEIRPGLSMRVTEQTARELGILPPGPEPEEKMERPARNKMRRKARNKAVEP